MALPPPPPPSSQPTPPAPPPPPAAKGGNRTLIIILCVLGGFVLLIGGCVTTCAYIGAKKAKEYSLSAQKNPAFASLSLIASLHPDIQVVSKDEASGKITVRNKKTGEIVTIDTNDYSSDNIGKALEKIAQGTKAAAAKAGAEQAENTSASESKADDSPAPPVSERKVSGAQAVALKSALKKFPDDFPIYDGGGATTTAASKNSIGPATSYQHSFTTRDTPEDVVSLYQKKMTAAGYTQLANENGSDSNGPTANAVFQKAEGAATFNVKADIEDGKTHVEVSQLVITKP